MLPMSLVPLETIYRSLIPCAFNTIGLHFLHAELRSPLKGDRSPCLRRLICRKRQAE
jgi:hypothetical protein